MLNLEPIEESQWTRKLNVDIRQEENFVQLVHNLDSIMRVAVAKNTTREMGFITLYTNGNSSYWFKVSRGFITALNENLSSLEKLIDDSKDSTLSKEQKEQINIVYRMLHTMYD